MILLKRVMVFLFVFVVLSARGSCTETVRGNFYLRGTKEELRILPNTLRTELFVGESEEFFVEVYPEKTAAGISWELENNNGTVSIFPEEERCTLLANKAGEETVLVFLRGGESAEISVRVNPTPEINPRTFEIPEKKDDREELLAKILRFLIYGLTAAGAGLTLFAVISFIRRRRK